MQDPSPASKHDLAAKPQKPAVPPEIPDAAAWKPEFHPELRGHSAAVVGLRAVPVDRQAATTEFVRIPMPVRFQTEDEMRLVTSVSSFNLTWQSRAAIGNWRFGADDLHELDSRLQSVINRTPEATELRLIPEFIDDPARSFLSRHQSLYQLLPLSILKRFGLQPFQSGTWPQLPFAVPRMSGAVDRSLPSAFAAHVWPLLVPQSGPMAFSKDDPIHLPSVPMYVRH